MQAAFHTALTRLTGRFAWLGVLAMLLLQFELAAHVHDGHELAFEADSHCEICLKLDKNGSAPLAQMPNHELPIAGSTLLPARISPSLASVRCSLRSRGPPTS